MILHAWKNRTRASCRLGRHVFVVFAIIGLTAACYHSAQEQPLSLVLPNIGATATESFTVAGKSIPLPAGDWTVIGSQIIKDDERGYHVAHMLARIEGNTLHSAIEVYTNLAITKTADIDDAGKGWLTYRSCSRDDMHYLKVYSNTRLGKQDCWLVNHWRMSGNLTQENWIEARKYFSDNKIIAPLDMVAATFRFANERDYLTATYFFNPEKSGFSGNNDVYWEIGTWKTSVWHPDNVKGDDKKINYISAIISWGTQWHEKLKASVGL